MRGQSHSTIVYVTVPGQPDGNTQTTFLIGDQPLMRFARLTAIEALSEEDLAYGMPGGPPVITGAELNKVTLTINCNDPDIIPAPIRGSTLEAFQNMPLTSLHRIQSAAGVPFTRQLLELFNVIPDWTKCKFELTPGGLGNTESVCIALQVWYTWTAILLPGQNVPSMLPRQ